MIKEVYPKETYCQCIEWDGSNIDEIKNFIGSDNVIHLDPQTLIINKKFECLISDIILKSKSLIFVMNQEKFKTTFNEIKKPE